MFVVSHTFPMLWELDGFLLDTKNVRNPQFEMFVLSQTFLLLWEFTFPIFWELYGFLLNSKYLRNPCLFFCHTFSVFFFIYFIQSHVFYPQLTLRQLIQPGLESRFIVTSQLGPSIQSGYSPSAGLQVVTWITGSQSTQLSKDCYPQLVSNPQRSEIRPSQQLGYRGMSLHPVHYGNSLFP